MWGLATPYAFYETMLDVCTLIAYIRLMPASALPHPDVMPSRQRRLEGLRAALVETRKSWCWWWGKFWTLRWENTLRRPSWRGEEKNTARPRMRRGGGRYAAVQAQSRHIHASDAPAG